MDDLKKEVPEEQIPVEAQNTDLVDEKGVSWKNRAKENERKLAEERRLREDAEQRLNSVPAQAEPPAEADDEWTAQQRKLAREEFQKERNADKAMRRILDSLEQTNPSVKKYRGEIENELEGLTWNLRSNSGSIKVIADSIIGRNIDKILADTETINDRKSGRLAMVNGSEVLSPTPTSTPQSVTLSEEETLFADDKRLWDKFSDSEIREMYQKRKKKLEAKK